MNTFTLVVYITVMKKKEEEKSEQKGYNSEYHRIQIFAYKLIVCNFLYLCHTFDALKDFFLLHVYVYSNFEILTANLYLFPFIWFDAFHLPGL